jgi:adenylate kinase
MNLIMLGAQGSGKGTQAQRLAEQLQLKPCSSGELLRRAIAQGTELGKAAQPYVERGDLVPDELILGVVLQTLDQLEGRRGVILDGFPRTVAQARALDEQLAERQQQVDVVVYLDVPREELVRRLEGRYVCRAAGHIWNVLTNPPRLPGICDYDGSALYQRPDDTSEGIHRRLDIFFSETIQLTDYYGAQGKLLRVDGSGSIEEVHARIMAQLERLGI